jgi:ATP-dependent DNA helicase RecQ
MSGARRVMVATNAFGMGIDKPDVRGIVHYQMPGTLEAYYHESGRAGRDRAPADCTLLFDARDKRVQQFFLARRYPESEELAAIYAGLGALDASAAATTFEALRDRLDGVAVNKLEVGLRLLKDAGVVSQDRKLSGRAARRLRVHSAWMDGLHRARKRPVSASPIRKSRSGAG